MNTKRLSAVIGGLAATLMYAAPALADPVSADPALPVPLLPGPAPGPAPDGTVVEAAGTLPTPPDGMQHLSSPENLPPGATMDPSATGGDSPNVSYLKDLWQAVQNHEISGKEALIMGLAQRGMNTPYPQEAPGPNVPVTPASAPPPETVAPSPVVPPSP